MFDLFEDPFVVPVSVDRIAGPGVKRSSGRLWRRPADRMTAASPAKTGRGPRATCPTCLRSICRLFVDRIARPGDKRSSSRCGAVSARVGIGAQTVPLRGDEGTDRRTCCVLFRAAECFGHSFPVDCDSSKDFPWPLCAREAPGMVGRAGGLSPG